MQPAVGAKPCARRMDEHRAAASLHARPRVVVELDDEIVEVVGAREAVGIAVGRKLDRLIVVAIGRILAPGVVLL